MGKGNKGPRFSMQEVVALLKASQTGQDLDAAMQAVIAGRETDNRIDRAALQAGVLGIIATQPREKQSNYFAQLDKLDALFRSMIAEQQAAIKTVLAQITPEESALIKWTCAALPSAENGNKRHVESLGASVAERKPTVHGPDFQRASGWKLVVDAQGKTTEDTMPWYNALKAAQTSSADGLLHNADFRAAYATITGKDTNSNFAPETVAWGVLVEKVYAPK